MQYSSCWLLVLTLPPLVGRRITNGHSGGASAGGRARRPFNSALSWSARETVTSIPKINSTVLLIECVCDVCIAADSLATFGTRALAPLAHLMDTGRSQLGRLETYILLVGLPSRGTRSQGPQQVVLSQASPYHARATQL